MRNSNNGLRLVTSADAPVEKVHVSIDGSNMVWSMRGMQSFGDTRRRDLNMGKLADVIAAKRNRPSVAVSVTVGFGVVAESVDPFRFDREMAMVARWERDSRVTVEVRTLRHDPMTGRNHEKGVDMALGLDFTFAQRSGLVDAVVLASGDSDFSPVVEYALANAGGAHIELARWSSQRGGPWVEGRPLWCHYLDEVDFGRCTIPRGFRDAA